jgi:hypothetical protein
MAELRCRRIGAAFLGVAAAWCVWGGSDVQAQQWRMRISSRVQYVEGQTLVRDSVPVGSAVGGGTQRLVGDTVVTCATGADYCYFYRSGEVAHTYPTVVDVDANVFGFGVEGLRFYVSTRFLTNFGGTEFWPPGDEFYLLNAYAELNRSLFRVRLGRDYKLSQLGYYGYDGGSLLFRLKPWRTEVEAYGGWGLERGVPEPANSDAFGSLGVFQPQDRNYLFGFRGSLRPTPTLSIDGIYQREIPTNLDGLASERLGFSASWAPIADLTLSGHADYDLAAGWWGKMGIKAGYQAHRLVYVEGGYIRYRPVFSLQTIWLAFSPVAYNGWNLGVRVRATDDLSLKAWAERRTYDETEGESPFLVTTDRDWRAGIRGTYSPFEKWQLDGGYWLNWGFGSALSSGDLRVGFSPRADLNFGARFSAFQQLEEFRLNEGRVWGLGGDARWRTGGGTVWVSLDHYDFDNRGDAALVDWGQWRGALGFSYYLGSEPGRAP